MVYAAIGGMQLKRKLGWLTIIIPTVRVLKAANKADGCFQADTFKAGDVFFAVSVWDSQEAMQAFARGGLHGTLASVAMAEMAMFYNHTQTFDEKPSRAACEAAWKAAIDARDGAGTVGSYSA